VSTVDPKDAVWLSHGLDKMSEQQELPSPRESTDLTNVVERIAHVGHWRWDIESGALAWSDEIYRILGLIPQSFGSTYEAFLEAAHPDDRATVQRRSRSFRRRQTAAHAGDGRRYHQFLYANDGATQGAAGAAGDRNNHVGKKDKDIAHGLGSPIRNFDKLTKRGSDPVAAICRHFEVPSAA
jgi:hypothetical protein